MANINKANIDKEVNIRKGRLRYRMSWIFAIAALIALSYFVYEMVILFTK